MSADNGIYVCKFPEGYRVIYMHAVDNLTYGSIEEQDEFRKEVFKNVPLIEDEDEAWRIARKMAEDRYYLEYGISQIDMKRSLT